MSEGRLCERGWAAHDAARWGARFHEPHIREHGVLRPASWDEALGVAAKSLRSLRDRGRPVGVLGSGRASNEENFLAVALARVALHTGNVDAGLRRCYEDLLAALEQPAAAADREDGIRRLERSDVIVLIEGDLTTSHPRVAMGVLRALRRGGRLITAGWSRTQMSRLATVHLPLSAAMPVSTLAALRQAFTELAVRGDAVGARGAGASAVERAASIVAESRRVAFVLTPFDADSVVLRTAASLIAALADDVAAAGGTPPLVLPLPVRANTCGAFDMGVAPHLLPGRRSLEDHDARDRLRAVWGTEPCWSGGLSAEEMIDSVSGLVVLADDVTEFHRRPDRAVAALQSLDTLVVFDSFVTPTTKAAHVVLPIAAFGETAGTITSLEGRVQRWRSAADAPHSIRPGWRALRDLLDALGATYAPQSLDVLLRDIWTAVPSYGAIAPAALDAAGGAVLEDSGAPRRATPVADAMRRTASRRVGAAPAEAPSDATADAMRWLLRGEGVFDWGDDPLVTSSPILRRTPASERKLRPTGVVMMSTDDAERLGVRDGWTIRVRSRSGEAHVAVSLRAGQERGVLFVPFAYRDRLSALSGDGGAVEVEVSRA